MVIIIEGRRYCCATCYWWQGRIGEEGECTIYESPSTVNCGRQPWDSLCEQHDFPDEPQALNRQLAVKHHQRVLWLKQHAHHRALWWEGGALSGIDPGPG